jgi:hypothetical protein
VVVVAELHGHYAPLPFAREAIEHLDHHCVVSIGEHVGLDQHLVADRALDGIAPAVDRRPDRLDDRARGRGLYLFARLIQA